MLGEPVDVYDPVTLQLEVEDGDNVNVGLEETVSVFENVGEIVAVIVLLDDRVSVDEVESLSEGDDENEPVSVLVELNEVVKEMDPVSVAVGLMDPEIDDEVEADEVTEGLVAILESCKQNITPESLLNQMDPSAPMARSEEREFPSSASSQFNVPEELTEYTYPLCVPTYTNPEASTAGAPTILPITAYDHLELPPKVKDSRAVPLPKYKFPDASIAIGDVML